MPGLEQQVEQIIKELGLSTVIYQTLMQDINKYYLSGIDSVENMLQINFETVNPRVLEYLKDYNFNLVKDMNTELANKLRATISRNLMTGDKRNMINEIKNVFDTTIDRAKTIARTETARAYAMGEFVGAKQAKDRGFNSRKYWLTAQDDRVCPICVGLGNKYPRENAIDIDKEFISPDGNFRGLTNPSHPNCRCSVIYIGD